ATFNCGVAESTTSPPPTRPWRASRKSTEALPEVGVPCGWMGVADDCHERPASVVRRTRATAAAPVASQALLSPWVAAQVPLAANAPPPGGTPAVLFDSRQ